MKKMAELKLLSISVFRFLIFFVTAWSAALVWADQRTICLLPLGTYAIGQSVGTEYSPDQLFGEPNDPWNAYMSVWRSHHRDPANLDVRRLLGLPLEGPSIFQARRGRSSPRWLGWQPGTFAQVETSHFSIYSTADEAATRTVAEDLEACFWVWTQLFFPLWEGAAQVSSAFADYEQGSSIEEYLAEKRPRLSIRRKFQVVLLKDAEQYRKTLQAEGSGIELSTGFYSDSLRTIFLYNSGSDAAETRRHELTHQLFREATRSSLGQTTPGEQKDFWLVEGIAGYMESMALRGKVALIGGWDSPRLQYARYRVLVGRDQMTPQELMNDGRDQAQQRSDLARWYSHSIAHVHAMMDGGDGEARRWLYHRLSSLYRSRSPMDALANQERIEDRLMQSWGMDLQRYLQVDDRTLLAFPTSRELRVLCLSGCEVTQASLQELPDSSAMTWLDLASIPVGNETIKKLIPQPAQLEQLTLEITKVNDGLSDWISQARGLRELDMSWTPVGDEFLNSIQGCRELSVLWMTGTQLTDKSVDVLIQLQGLESLDVQRTQISPAGLDRIRKAHPRLQLNPLELRSP